MTILCLGQQQTVQALAIHVCFLTAVFGVECGGSCSFELPFWRKLRPRKRSLPRIIQGKRGADSSLPVTCGRTRDLIVSLPLLLVVLPCKFIVFPFHSYLNEEVWDVKKKKIWSDFVQLTWSIYMKQVYNSCFNQLITTPVNGRWLQSFLFPFND